MTNILRQKKGFALAYSLLFIFLIVSFVGIYLSVALGGLNLTNRSADLKRAYYIADAGLADAFMQLRAYAMGMAPSTFNVNNSNYPIGPGKAGSYSITAVSDGATWPTYTITSVGTFGGQSKTIELKVKEASFSKWAYISNTENHPVYGPLWWITGMITSGPVFTNGQLNLYGDPVFNGPVSQVSPTINFYHGGPPLDNPLFSGGLTLNAPSIALPSAAILSGLDTQAQSGGLYLTGDSAVTFNSDGTINVTNAAKGWNNVNMAVPANKVVYVKSGSVTVQGVLNGQLTVAAESNVYINGNLSYNSDPRLNTSSTDLLGLVAQQDITVTMSAPNNLEVDGVLVALNGSFQVDQFWAGIRGNMVQYGGLINNVSGPTGIFDPSTATLYGGYNQLQFYDPRLRDLVPPGIPPASDASGRLNYARVSLREL